MELCGADDLTRGKLPKKNKKYDAAEQEGTNCEACSIDRKHLASQIRPSPTWKVQRGFRSGACVFFACEYLESPSEKNGSMTPLFWVMTPVVFRAIGDSR